MDFREDMRRDSDDMIGRQSELEKAAERKEWKKGESILHLPEMNDHDIYLDFEGHIKTPEIEKILNEIKPKCSFFKWLGSYPST